MVIFLEAASPLPLFLFNNAIARHKHIKALASLFFIVVFYSHHKHPKYLVRALKYGHCLSQKFLVAAAVLNKTNYVQSHTDNAMQ